MLVLLLPMTSHKILLLLICFSFALSSSSQIVISPNCPKKCGNVSIPYPFGLLGGCYLNDNFQVTCNETTEGFKPFLQGIPDSEVTNISLDGEMTIRSSIISNCYENNTLEGFDMAYYIFGFSLSTTRNQLTGVGCDTLATISIKFGDGSSSGCLSNCRSLDSVTEGTCDGFGCCQTAIPKNLQFFTVGVEVYKNVTDVRNISPCSYAFVGESAAFNFSKLDLKDMQGRKTVSTVVDWFLWNETCADEALKNSSFSACKAKNSVCIEPALVNGYRCNCSSGYQGNPYLPDGCQDINECEDSRDNRCVGIATCINTAGGYNCSCPVGYRGDGRLDGEGCIPEFLIRRSNQTLVKITAGVCGSIGALLLLVCARWLFQAIKRRNQKKLKEKFFKRNGGLLLQQQLSSSEGNIERAGKLFNSKELEKATDNFSINRILGRGGQGTVYKGMLMDGRIVAVKKSLFLDEGNVEQFINEVFILSQINHRNVVGLLGCCLETEVPLLVYEFIPNGTLYHFLHNPNEEFPISWEMRLKIAIEVAGALSYLHSAASIPIFHRDIKTANILLDEKFCAKIADFGTSKTVALDQTHVTTRVQGTFGYLDPQYFQTSQFTDKSDVYSFGVVLVELLTGHKAVSSVEAFEGRGLAMNFVISLKEDRLFDIVDARVLSQAKREEILAVAEIARRCLNLKGKKRPSMKEVTTELESIRKLQYEVHDDQAEGKGKNTGVEGTEGVEEFEAEDYSISNPDETSLLYSNSSSGYTHTF